MWGGHRYLRWDPGWEGIWGCSGGWGRGLGLLGLSPRAQVYECVAISEYVCRCLCGDIPMSCSTWRSCPSEHASEEPGLWHGLFLGLSGHGGREAGARYASLGLVKGFSLGLGVSVWLDLSV